MATEFDPRTEALKDSQYVYLRRLSWKLWEEYSELMTHVLREAEMRPYPAGYDELIDMTNADYAKFIKADNAADARYQSVYTSLGGQ
jgi:hypothetical protein